MNTTHEGDGKEFIPLRPEKLRSLGKDEHWLESAIIDDPSILGLGDLIVFDNQRTQPSGGRLDLLLGRDDERYELELQLGVTDETHIVRTIEYWDIEKRRFPNYEHTAIITAEEISGRFFNVINLFGYHIPIIALKVTAYRIENKIALSFTKVLDTRDLIATVEDNEIAPPVDREYWVQYFSVELLQLAENAITKITNGVPNYNKYYIGSVIDGSRNAGLKVWSKNNKVALGLYMREIPEVTERIEAIEIYRGYLRGDRGYGFVLENEEQLNQHLPIFRKMFDLVMGNDDGIWPQDSEASTEADIVEGFDADIDSADKSPVDSM